MYMRRFYKVDWSDKLLREIRENYLTNVIVMQLARRSEPPTETQAPIGDNIDRDLMQPHE